MRLLILSAIVGSLIMLSRWLSLPTAEFDSTLAPGVPTLEESAVDVDAEANVADVSGCCQLCCKRVGQSVVASNSAVSPTGKSELPANARNVQQLSRATYELPSEAAELLKKFLSLNSGCLVETKIINDTDVDVVVLEVTASEKTQRSVGNFLFELYPPDKLAKSNNGPGVLKKVYSVRSQISTNQCSVLPKLSRKSGP